MDKLTAIKIKYDDGTYSDEIPVSVLSENVEWDNTHTLVDVLGSIDVDVTGTIQDQISQLFNEKVSSSELNNYVASQLNEDIVRWLNDNVNPVGSAVVVDKSLTIEGAAADAKIIGDIIGDYKIYTHTTTAAEGQYINFYFNQDSVLPKGTKIKVCIKSYSGSLYQSAVVKGTNFAPVTNLVLGEPKTITLTSSNCSQIWIQLKRSAKEDATIVYFLGIERENDIGLANDIFELQTNTSELQTDVSELQTDVSELQTDVSELQTDVSEFIWQKESSVISPSSNVQFDFNFEEGKKYRIINNTSGAITPQLWYNNVMISNLGNINSGQYKDFTTPQELDMIRCWCGPAAVAGETVKLIYLQTSIAELQTNVSELQTNTSELQTEVSEINFIRDYDIICPSSAAIGEYWNTYIPVTLSAGAKINFNFVNYDGNYFRYVRVQGKRQDTETYQTLVRETTFPISKTFILENNITEFFVQIARTQKETGNNAKFNFKFLNTVYGKTYEELLKAIDNQKTFIIDKKGNGDFTTIVDCINFINNNNIMDARVYLGTGEYDLIDELGNDFIESVSSDKRGLYLKNRIHIIGSSTSKIVLNYTGTREQTVTWLSAFNTGDYGFTLENVTIETTHCRYTIHDEMDKHVIPYECKYINCKFKHDNTNGGFRQVIGGGLGYDGHIIIDGCIFEQPNSGNSEAIVSYHNTWYAFEDPTQEYYQHGKSFIDISNSYFINGTCQISAFGESQDISTMIVHGCSLRSTPKHITESPSYQESHPWWIDNVELITWNNEIRSS